MLSSGKLGEETKKLYESSLSCDSINEGPDGANAANSNANLGFYYAQVAEKELNNVMKKKHLLKAEKYYHEAMRITVKRNDEMEKTAEYAMNLFEVKEMLEML